MYFRKGSSLKGTILIPNKFNKKHYVSDRYSFLFELIAERTGFNLLYFDDVNKYDSDDDVLVLFKCPQDDKPDRGIKFVDLNRKTKLVLYYSDISPKNFKCMINTDKLMDRADLIMCSYDERFKKIFGSHISKYKWFPHFFAPTERYTKLEIGYEITNKCLAPGRTDSRFYRLRMKAVDNKLFDALNHPGYRSVEGVDSGKYKIKDDFAYELNKYFCCLTCCSAYRYALAKHFEIPAAGSLLITDRCEDLDKLGFISDKHYIEVNQNNVFDKVKHIIENHEDYIDVLKEGRKFVIDNFSLEHATNRFISNLETVL